MRESINASECKTIEAIQNRLEKLYKKFEKDDVALNFGNGTVSEQLNCAMAALECILQEY